MSSIYKVSICIPAYQNATVLKRCINSIINQSYANFEVIITDDSEDFEVQNLVRDTNDSRLLYFKNKTPLGSPSNWNESIRLATGDLIKIMHHDDWFVSNNALQEFVNIFMLKPNTQFAFSQCFNVSNTKTKLHKPTLAFLKKLKQNPDILLFQNGIGAPSVTIFSKSVAEECKFDNTSLWYVDILFYIQVLSKKNCYAYINKPLINITSGAEFQVTNSTKGIIKVKEAVYAFSMLGYFNKNKYNLFVLMLFIELFTRYKLSDLKDLAEHKLENNILGRLNLAFKISKISISYKFFALIRILLVNHLPFKLIGV